jgi:GH15 family glucan-1,4-alpha-glucosidase
MRKEIEDYGLIGNLQTTALVSKKDASIDFFCFPFCDSPSIFARLLDEEGGGHFRICPAIPDFRTKQLYLPSSNVLQTRFSLPEGIAQVTDLMPVYQEEIEGRERTVIKPWLIRKVDIVRGCLSLEVECRPAFMYGLDAHQSSIDCESGTITFQSLHDTLQLSQHHSCSRKFVDLIDGSKLQLRMGEGESMILCLKEADGDHFEYPLLQSIIDKTNGYWNKWISKSAYKGRWREIVNRSALVLKMLTFHETGAIIASPTFSLPEEIGGSLNWDYRFTWIRDAAFTVYGFLRIGLKQEAEAFMDWIQRKCEKLVNMSSRYQSASLWLLVSRIKLEKICAFYTMFTGKLSTLMHLL